MSVCAVTAPPSGDEIRPEVSVDYARDLVKRLYGMTAISINELVSYVDRNFHVYVEDHYENKWVDTICCHGYVLKIMNSDDSKRPDHIEAQNMVVLHLSERGMRVPKPVKNVNGKLMSLEYMVKHRAAPQNGLKQEKRNKMYMVRLLEYIPGELILKFPFTPVLMYRVGGITGKMDYCLKTFNHPAYKTYKGSWCLTEIKNVWACLSCITDRAQRTLLSEVVSAVERNVLDKYDSFSKGTIHGDMNQFNILLCSDDDQKVNFDENSEIGILDFGDTVDSCYIFEISVLLCYILMTSKPEKRLENAGYALAGYLSKFPLPRHDLNVLKECISGRLAQSFVISKYSAIKDPQNAEYLLINHSQTWDCLSKLWAMSKEDLDTALQCYIDLYDSKKQDKKKYKRF